MLPEPETDISRFRVHRWTGEGCPGRLSSQGHGGDVDRQHQQDTNAHRASHPWRELVAIAFFQASLALAAGHRRLPPDRSAHGDVSARSYSRAASVTTLNRSGRNPAGIVTPCAPTPSAPPEADPMGDRLPALARRRRSRNTASIGPRRRIPQPEGRRTEAAASTLPRRSRAPRHLLAPGPTEGNPHRRLVMRRSSWP